MGNIHTYHLSQCLIFQNCITHISYVFYCHHLFNPTGYDGVKTFAKRKNVKDGPLLHTVSSIAASFCASLFSSPADMLMTKYMSHSGRNAPTLYHCALSIYNTDGIMGFWRGWGLNFVRLTPVMLTFSVLYEQIRFQMGVGYMS